MVRWPFKKKSEKTPVKRSIGFSSADYSRLTASLASDTDHIMRILRYQGKTLRARSRQVVNSTPYGAKYVQMCVNNICGAKPFGLQAKNKFASGKYDTSANKRIETEWALWGKPSQCDIESRQSWADLQRLIVRSIAVDGEALIRIVQGSEAGPWGLQLQIIDVDRLDEEKNEELSNGNIIIAGVEIDTVGRTVAYHLLKRKPKDWQHCVVKEYVRIPAEQMLHLFTPLYAEQVRGVPWMFAAILELHRIGKFEEAAIVAAWVGASKMGFYQQKGGDTLVPDDSTVDADGNYVQSAEAGEFGVVPAGYEMKDWSPNYPDAQVGPFLKTALRSVASGLNVAYHSFGNDLSDVNFSSARAGILEERDHWMMLQEWLIEHLHEPVYGLWLNNSMLLKRLPFPLGRIDKYMDVFFQPRRWPWVDPLKDVQASVLAIDNALKSRTAVVSEGGGDIEDVFDQIAMEGELAKEKKVNLSSENKGESHAEEKEDDDTE